MLGTVLHFLKLVANLILLSFMLNYASLISYPSGITGYAQSCSCLKLPLLALLLLGLFSYAKQPLSALLPRLALVGSAMLYGLD